MQVTHAVGTDAPPYHHKWTQKTWLVFAIFVANSLDGLFPLWHVESNVHFSQKQAEMWTRLTREDVSSVFRSISDDFEPRELVAFLRKMNKCLPLCIIQFQVAFLDTAADCVEWQQFSKLLPSQWGNVHHGSMMVSQTIPPEGLMVTHIQQRLTPLAFTHRDFPWLPESFHDIMNCGWWKTILYWEALSLNWLKILSWSLQNTRFVNIGLPMLCTEGWGFESRLCQGLGLAGSSWSDIIGSSLQGRGEDSGNLRPLHCKLLGLLE